MTVHNETDLLGLTRAEKKLNHWQDIQKEGITTVTSKEDGTVYEVLERIEYWTKQVVKYRTRIEKHIQDFQKINDFWGFTNWITGVIETIKDILKTLNIKI